MTWTGLDSLNVSTAVITFIGTEIIGSIESFNLDTREVCYS